MLRLPALATAVLVALTLAFVASGWQGERRKLAALLPLPPQGSYAVTLAFAPERFHQVQLQDKGRVVEVRGHTVYMKDVAPPALADIAREYWVTSIAAWSGT